MDKLDITKIPLNNNNNKRNLDFDLDTNYKLLNDNILFIENIKKLNINKSNIKENFIENINKIFIKKFNRYKIQDNELDFNIDLSMDSLCYLYISIINNELKSLKKPKNIKINFIKSLNKFLFIDIDLYKFKYNNDENLAKKLDNLNTICDINNIYKEFHQSQHVLTIINNDIINDIKYYTIDTITKLLNENKLNFKIFINNNDIRINIVNSR